MAAGGVTWYYYWCFAYSDLYEQEQLKERYKEVMVAITAEHFSK